MEPEKEIAMRKLVLASLLALAALPGTARPQPQVRLQIHLGLPPQPPLLLVQPGVQVVENWNEEVFFSGGWYWCRRDDGWYRARTPRAAFAWVEPRRVPPALVRMPPGHYRHFRREQARAEERAWHERQREERRERERAERREHRAPGHEPGRGEGRGHGHGHGDHDRD
jgi:hypothetical protein